jgi:hypothetical protein
MLPPQALAWMYGVRWAWLRQSLRRGTGGVDSGMTCYSGGSDWSHLLSPSGWTSRGEA